MGSSVSASRVGALRRRWEEADKIIDGEREEEPELDRDVLDGLIGRFPSFTS